MPRIYSQASTLSAQRPSKMSTSPKKAEDGGRRISVGSVAVRPAKEIKEELERACRHDRRVLSTPIPRPTSGAPHRFFISQRPPLPAPPPCRQADVGPAASPAERRAAAAAISVRVREDTEAVIGPLRDLAASSSATPRPASPERASDDYYDLAKWRRWHARWN